MIKLVYNLLNIIIKTFLSGYFIISFLNIGNNNIFINGFQITLNTYDLNDINCNNDPIIILRATRCSPGMGYIDIDIDNNVLSFNNIDNTPSLELCNSTIETKSKNQKTNNGNTNDLEIDEDETNEFNMNNQYFNIDECFEDNQENKRSSKFTINENNDNPTILNGYCNLIKMFDCNNYYIHSFKNNTCFKDNGNLFTLMHCDQDNIYIQDCLNSDCSIENCYLNKIISSNINKCPNFKIFENINYNISNTNINITNNNITISNNNITNINNNNKMNSTNNIKSNLNNTINRNIEFNNNKTKIVNLKNNTTEIKNNNTNNDNYFYPKVEQSITSDSNSNKNGIKKHNNSTISSISLTSTSSSLTLSQYINFKQLLLLILVVISVNYLL